MVTFTSDVEYRGHNYWMHFINELRSAMPRTAWSLDDLRSCVLISQPFFVWTLIQVVLQIHEWLWEVSPQKWQKCVNLRDWIIWLELSQGFQKGCEQKAWKHKQNSGFCLTTEWNKIQKFVHAHRLMSRDGNVNFISWAR